VTRILVIAICEIEKWEQNIILFIKIKINSMVCNYIIFTLAITVHVQAFNTESTDWKLRNTYEINTFVNFSTFE